MLHAQDRASQPLYGTDRGRLPECDLMSQSLGFRASKSCSHLGSRTEEILFSKLRLRQPHLSFAYCQVLEKC